jgi:hypothetical protein
MDATVDVEGRRFLNVELGVGLAIWMSMEELRKLSDRRQLTRSGRRTTDPQPVQCFCIETRQEVARLRSVVQVLADAVQALTATRDKP